MTDTHSASAPPSASVSAQRARADRLAADGAALRLRLAEAERERDERERQIVHLRRELAETARRLGEADRARATEAHRADQAEWQAEVLRRRRWTRLGGALGRLARRPLSPGSYRGLRAAARVRPAPQAPPKNPRLPKHPEVRAVDTEPFDGVPALEFPDGPVNRPELTAAVLANPPVEAALRYEWRQLDRFPPDGWRAAFEAEPPDLLFVESGAAASTPDGSPLEEMAAWCREHDVPTVFWDTGDDDSPDPAATLFDHVFTVDAARVRALREALGHDRVHVLPFAAQPRLHTPIRGADHGRYPLLYEGDYDPGAEALLGPAPKLGAHFYGSDFPSLYRQRVVPALPYEKALTARKRYRVLLAPHPRLAYEAAAAGVPIVHTADDPLAFGPAVGDAQDASRLLGALLAGPEMRDRQAHLALRRIHAEHTYRHRVDSVLEALGTSHPEAQRAEPPLVSLVLPTCRAEQIAQAIEHVARQVWRPLQLVLVLHGIDLDPVVVEKQARAAGIDDIVVLPADRSLSLGECLNLGIEAADGAYIGKMDDDELYGPHYVSDLVPAFSYTEASVVGKLAHYTHLESIDAMVLRHPGLEHRYVNLLRGGALLADGDLLREYRFAEVGRGEDTDLFRRLREDGVRVYAADRYSFITIRHADPGRHTWQPSDLELLADARLAHYGLTEEHILF
ncbi:glycosyltransferase [Actinomadura rugatobispora]|uniref:Glycosyltransferase n=1 Tax=Actinomadura rugatobispora TaxID=1994 RepID=A0ABW1A4M3_9ACTN|nr:glycosyltransferase [Actinomadura rugatobispora]